MMKESVLDFVKIKQTAETWTREAGEYIKDQMASSSFAISTKANPHDLVTDVDKNVEAFFLDKIRKTYPDHRLMGEEGSFEEIKDLNGTVWILDPIDGTINFVHQSSHFAISIGIYQDGHPVIGIVYDVMNNDMYSSLKGEGATLNEEKIPPIINHSLNESILSFNSGWMLEDRRLERLVKEVRGVRSYGVAALEMAYVAVGKLDAYISFNLAPWDIAGGYALLVEVGGKATNYEGKPLDFLKKDTLIAASPSIHKDIFNIITK
ncbi:inositol monophosphatase family protein [Salipaludibacillus agaradhaerens]|uniref:inositol monophosphatase family protein n=1 Tax=Salipaludibacillus agaradhaerens TaxID=76935 RepID=UPI002150AD1F|nr:inositol monophosphatase family protein [Salipaludibacillus agaradhaerens]